MLGILGIKTQSSILEEELGLKNKELEKLQRELTKKNIELKAHENELSIVSRTMSSALDEQRDRATKIAAEMAETKEQALALQVKSFFCWQKG